MACLEAPAIHHRSGPRLKPWLCQKGKPRSGGKARFTTTVTQSGETPGSTGFLILASGFTMDGFPGCLVACVEAPGFWFTVSHQFPSAGDAGAYGAAVSHLPGARGVCSRCRGELPPLPPPRGRCRFQSKLAQHHLRKTSLGKHTDARMPGNGTKQLAEVPSTGFFPPW